MAREPRRRTVWTGNPETFRRLPFIGRLGHRSQTLEAVSRNAHTLAMVSEAQKAGARTNAEVAEWLNVAGHRTMRGLPWNRFAVQRTRAEWGPGGIAPRRIYTQAEAEPPAATRRRAAPCNAEPAEPETSHAE